MSQKMSFCVPDRVFLYLVSWTCVTSHMFSYCVCVCALSLDSSGDCVSLTTERQVFLATWKDIPNENESQFQIKDCHLNSGEEDGKRALCPEPPYPAAPSYVETAHSDHLKPTLMKRIAFDENSSAARDNLVLHQCESS